MTLILRNILKTYALVPKATFISGPSAIPDPVVHAPSQALGVVAFWSQLELAHSSQT